jgi:multicomponent Na+:H+ antiporter subunit C
MTLLGWLPWAVGGWLLLCGLAGVAWSRNVIHLTGCLAIAQSGTYVLLVGIGWLPGGAAPVLKELPRETPIVDPVVQALVLTDIVVEATVFALLLALAVHAFRSVGSLDPRDIVEFEG